MGPVRESPEAPPNSRAFREINWSAIPACKAQSEFPVSRDVATVPEAR